MALYDPRQPGMRSDRVCDNESSRRGGINPGRSKMANIVLVHGAWHGGWCYRHTAAALRKMGHEVFTPTHTGVGERAHQANENITLETHIRNVVGCIEAEENERHCPRRPFLWRHGDNRSGRPHQSPCLS